MTIIHHVSIINRKAEPSFHFYRNVLGLDLMMKTVNQDDNQMYHLFFGDAKGQPGTEVTIFEIEDGADKQFGTNAIERLIFKVHSTEALYFWMERFDAFNICHYGLEHINGRDTVRFEAPDNTMLGLTVVHHDDNNVYPGPEHTDIPEDFRILSLDAIQLRVKYAQATINELERYYGFKVTDETSFFETDRQVTILRNQSSRFTHEIHIIHDNDNEDEVTGIGSIHHVALSIEGITELETLHKALSDRNFYLSPIKNREFFQSLYYREPNNILIEVATMEGHKIHQPDKDATQFYDIPLVLPDYLENKREKIEHLLKKKEGRA